MTFSFLVSCLLLVLMLEIQETISIAIEISIYNSFPSLNLLIQQNFSSLIILIFYIPYLTVFVQWLYSMCFFNAPQTLSLSRYILYYIDYMSMCHLMLTLADWHPMVFFTNCYALLFRRPLQIPVLI